MKTAILLLAAVGLANAFVILPGRERYNAVKKNVNTRDLNDLLQQFASFIPFEKCLEIVNRYMTNDPDVQKAWAFLQSDTFYALTDKVEKMQEYQDVILEILVRFWSGHLHLRKHHPPNTGTSTHRAQLRHSWVRESGIIKMINELLGVLPIDQIKDWFINVCLPDPDFQNLIQRILSPDFQKLVEAVTSTPEYQELLNVLREQGIDVEAIEKAIDDFFNSLGRKRYNVVKNSRDLNDLLQQFASFIPFEKCLEIVNKYMADDPDVQKAWAFLQSDTFYALTDKVEKMQEYQDVS
ncbi:hypothetical protein J437_LFUL013666 [Ladona fulva]|uniref:Uncharacterized protein n=1 Tax=Ladona fulva TaxID=123851 RepID=A0A8K0KGU5_LADFU|nr:hypothetical protein J437_LFUL013666 [Ladona fulva]